MRHAIVAFVLAVLLICAGARSATADAASDARAVTDALINQNVIDAMMDSIEPLTRQALQHSLSQGENVRLTSSAREVVITIFLKEFRARFLAAMRDEYVQLFMLELTPAELAGLHAFLETPVGRSYAGKQAAIIRAGSQMGGRVGRDIGIKVGQDLANRLATDGANLVANPTDLELLRRAFPRR